MKTLILVALFVAAMVVGASGFQSSVDVVAPPEKPVQFDNPARLDSLMAPYVQMARRSYLDAKA